MQKPSPPKSCDVSAILGYVTALERYVKELEVYIVFQEAQQSTERLTVQETADILHFDPRYVTKLFHAKRLTGKHYGNLLLIDRSSVVTYQASNTRSEVAT